MTLVIFWKILLDAGITVGAVIGRQWPLAVMFFGFAVADVGAFWVALK